MASVRISEFHRIAGVYEPVESVVDYTYCDKCGSFNINMSYPKRRLDDALVFVILGSYVAAITIGLLLHSLAVCGGLGIIGVITFLIYTWGKHLRCNTCGNERITSKNVLKYTEDNLPIDVPDDVIIKHFITTVIR
jgi:hypothetical protein